MANPYTARITARGEGSHAPDNESAVDAEIFCLGFWIGEATLVENKLGQLDTWGSAHNWADGALQRHLPGATEDIIAAVREAAR